MRSLLASLCLAMASLAAEESPPAKSVDQSENVQSRIAESDFVVDICIYEQEWIPANKENWKATLIKRAVVTGVHKGDIPVGTKLEYYHLIEEPPKLFKETFRSVVEGELRTFFFSRNDGTLKDGKYTLEGDGHFGFDRCKGDFAEAFANELKNNPDLKKRND
jgi:hypothetical protein